LAIAPLAPPVIYQAAPSQHIEYVAHGAAGEALEKNRACAVFYDEGRIAIAAAFSMLWHRAMAKKTARG
jgi:hypothetical protein